MDRNTMPNAMNAEYILDIDILKCENEQEKKKMLVFEKFT